MSQFLIPLWYIILVILPLFTLYHIFMIPFYLLNRIRLTKKVANKYKMIVGIPFLWIEKIFFGN